MNFMDNRTNEIQLKMNSIYLANEFLISSWNIQSNGNRCNDLIEKYPNTKIISTLQCDGNDKNEIKKYAMVKKSIGTVNNKW